MQTSHRAHKPRRAYEAGHRPKFLALVEDGPEADRALRFAARRARRVGAAVLLLAIVEPGEEAPPLLGVADQPWATKDWEAGRAWVALLGVAGALVLYLRATRAPAPSR